MNVVTFHAAKQSKVRSHLPGARVCPTILTTACINCVKSENPAACSIAKAFWVCSDTKSGYPANRCMDDHKCGFILTSALSGDRAVHHAQYLLRMIGQHNTLRIRETQYPPADRSVWQDMIHQKRSLLNHAPGTVGMISRRACLVGDANGLRRMSTTGIKLALIDLSICTPPDTALRPPSEQSLS